MNDNKIIGEVIQKCQRRRNIVENDEENELIETKRNHKKKCNCPRLTGFK